MFEKEGNAKTEKTCLTNITVENLSFLSTYEREIVKISRKASKSLSTCTTNDFKAVILTRGNVEKIEGVELAERHLS